MCSATATTVGTRGTPSSGEHPKVARGQSQYRDADSSQTTEGQLTVVSGLLHLLKQEGIRNVFGIPGGGIYPFYRAVEDDAAFTLIMSRHECGAAFMADAYARVGDEPGENMAVLATTSGPGAINAMNGVAVAFLEGIPMLVITGQAPTTAVGRGASQETSLQDINIVEMYRSITKYSAFVETPEKLPHHFYRALRTARSGCPGPVHLHIPVDLWSKPLDAKTFGRGYSGRTPAIFDREAVREAAKALVSARYPVFLVGCGASGAAARRNLAQLAEQINALVATTPRGKGLYAETLPRSLGVLGFGAHAGAKNVLLGDKADVLLIVGASMNEATTLNWDPRIAEGRKLIQVDIDPERIGRSYPVDIPIAGDSGAVTLELIHHVRRALESGAPLSSQWSASDFPSWGEEYFMSQANRRSVQTPITPERWRVELQECLPANAILFSDIGGHMLFNFHHFRIGPDQRFVINVDFGSMGHGTAGPVGAALAQPGRPIISIIGDSCFSMAGMEILTAKEYDLPATWIIENNGRQGIIWHASKMLSAGRTLNCVLNRTKVDYGSIVKGFGVPHWLVDKPGQISKALAGALGQRGPAVIEVVVDPEVAPPVGERVDSIAGFKK